MQPGRYALTVHQQGFREQTLELTLAVGQRLQADFALELGAVTEQVSVTATTNLIDHIGERTIQDQEKRVTFLRLDNLQTAEVDWPRHRQHCIPLDRASLPSRTTTSERRSRK